MYSKIMNLKSKLANYNNNAIQKTPDPHRENKQMLSKSYIESPSDNNNYRNQTIHNSDNKNFMETINELKKKWNVVSNRSNFNVSNDISPPLTPDKHKSNLSNDNITETNSNINKLNEIKNKYNNISKHRNNTVENKK